jgi:hypothetical protein
VYVKVFNLSDFSASARSKNLTLAQVSPFFILKALDTSLALGRD